MNSLIPTNLGKPKEPFKLYDAIELLVSEVDSFEGNKVGSSPRCHSWPLSCQMNTVKVTWTIWMGRSLPSGS